MKSFLKFIILFFSLNIISQVDNIAVVTDDNGMRLEVNGKPFIVNGMNWDYFPIGKNFEFNLWSQSDDFIKSALDSEMTLLKNMGVNTVRIYTGIQPKWITYIYNNFGIYTMLNHSFGRYGLTLNGEWTPITDYKNPEAQRVLLSEVTKVATEYKNTPGLLLFLLGNENNYGLFWSGAETEDFPDDEKQKRKLGEERGRPMYRLFNEAAKKIKAIDNNHPIAICNGDLLFLDMVVDECPDIDIYGTNMYRGKSFGDAFEKVKKDLNKPILFTEFGSDAFNALTNKEDQEMQAFYALENWKEIYNNVAGIGNANNSIGGFTFQFSDGWWKLGQTRRLETHDTGASWGNGGYKLDFKKGIDNMNEEWFGICAKGQTNSDGLYELYPRAAYYILKKIHEFNPYKNGITNKDVEKHFCKIKTKDALIKAKKNKTGLEKK